MYILITAEGQEAETLIINNKITFLTDTCKCDLFYNK